MLIPVTALKDAPARAHWRILHRACYPNPDGRNDYWIGVDRADTAAKLLHWAAHMGGKNLDTGDRLGQPAAPHPARQRYSALMNCHHCGKPPRRSIWHAVFAGGIYLCSRCTAGGMCE